jgi:protocatechuate 3,4-dioxygenase beta subunit
MPISDSGLGRRVSRREAIGAMAALGVGGGIALWHAARGNGAGLLAPRSSRLPRAGCTLAPELTEGPYYIASEPFRRDIREGRQGAPLEIDFTIQNAACQPLDGATVEIWHADALGNYSGFNLPGSFLRGQQTTDKDGHASFKTIYPGWYTGRAVHIHVKVHVGGNVVHTGQLFFNDSFTDKVFASTAPYDTRGQRDTLNSGDNIYSGGGASTLLNVKRARNRKGKKKKGYEAKISLSVNA